MVKKRSALHEVEELVEELMADMTLKQRIAFMRMLRDYALDQLSDGEEEAEEDEEEDEEEEEP
jgi:hypothetical protein